MKKNAPSFDQIYMNLASNLALRSHCVKQQVGAVLAKDTRIVSLGYNGPPAGTHNCDEEWPETGCARDRKGSCYLALHAEANAILKVAKSSQSTEGASLYVTYSPCKECSKLIIQSGIKNVFYSEDYRDTSGLIILKESGVNTLKLIP